MPRPNLVLIRVGPPSATIRKEARHAFHIFFCDTLRMSLENEGMNVDVDEDEDVPPKTVQLHWAGRGSGLGGVKPGAMFHSCSHEEAQTPAHVQIICQKAIRGRSPWPPPSVEK